MHSPWPRRIQSALLITAIALAFGSIAALVLRPAATGSLRTSLNISSLVLAFSVVSLAARRPRQAAE